MLVVSSSFECRVLNFTKKRPFIFYSKLQRDYTISLKNCKLGLYQLKVHFLKEEKKALY